VTPETALLIESLTVFEITWQYAEKVRQRRSRVAQRLNESFLKSEALEGLIRSPTSILEANGPTKCGTYLLASSLAAVLLDGLFEHPAATLT